MKRYYRPDIELHEFPKWVLLDVIGASGNDGDIQDIFGAD